MKGPFFPFLAPWVVDILCENQGGTSGQISVDDIPLTSATGCTVNFIKSLESCSSNKMISELFDTADGPAFEQIVGLSDWDQNEDITINNKAILADMLVYEELVQRRGKKINAMREGLAVLKYLIYVCHISGFRYRVSHFHLVHLSPPVGVASLSYT